MGNFKKLYATDGQLEQEGVWQELRGGITLRIRSAQSKQVRAANATMAERNKKYYKTNSPIPEAIQLKNEIELTIAAVADWKNVEDEKGAAVACTEEAKVEVFSDPQLYELRMQIIGIMSMAENFRTQELADDAKNSKTPLSLAAE